MTKRITALLLSVILCLSLTGTAFAAEADESSISAEAGSNEVTVKLTGLTEGATYYLCSLLVKESEDAAEEDFKIVKSFNFKAREGGVFEYAFNDETIPVLENGNVLRLRVPGAGFTNDYIEYTVGGEVPELSLPETATVYIGRTKTLTAVATGIDTEGAAWAWTSSDEEIATVAGESEEGTVTGVAAGTAEITVTLTTAGGKSYEAACTVTVSRQPSGGGGGGGGGSVSSGYAVSVNRTSNGSVSVSPSKAEKGDTVTITVRPNSGYELASLTVKDADGNTIRTTKVSDTEYTFVMPDSKVTVDAVFAAIEAETPAQPEVVSFTDVPSSYWAYQQITWAATKGIMNGYGGGIFGPENNTTRQALWMVLARLDGANPADMAAARSWAMANGVSDGTNAGGTMSRQQMVTMLYRYAQMKGYSTTGSASLSGYPDSGSVASYAQDALSWAVANGIVTGTSDGRLNPEGTASRAHFAVFMYRFCNLYGIA